MRLERWGDIEADLMRRQAPSVVGGEVRREPQLGRPLGQEDEPGRRDVGGGRAKRRQFVQLTQEGVRDRIEPPGVRRPCVTEELG